MNELKDGEHMFSIQSDSFQIEGYRHRLSLFSRNVKVRLIQITDILLLILKNDTLFLSSFITTYLLSARLGCRACTFRSLASSSTSHISSLSLIRPAWSVCKQREKNEKYLSFFSYLPFVYFWKYSCSTFLDSSFEI